MRVGKSGRDDAISSVNRFQLSDCVCPKCGSNGGSLMYEGVGKIPVHVCLDCDYCSLDDPSPEKVRSETGTGSGDVISSEDSCPDGGGATTCQRSECEDHRTAANRLKSSRTAQHPVIDEPVEAGLLESSSTSRVRRALKCDACGNVEEDVFVEVLGSHGQILRIQCMNCDEIVWKDSSEWSVKCDNCSNNSEKWFEKIVNGDVVMLVCLMCLNLIKSPVHLSPLELLTELKGLDKEDKKTAFVCKETPKRMHTRVRDLRQLKRGDHIAWDRDYLVWHHAIVTNVNLAADEITVIHNSGGIKDMPNGRIASVRVENFKVDCELEFLYVFEYNESECFSPDEVIDRATQRLDDSYDPLKNNCEHFARWCKTGLKYCLQRKDFDDRLKMGASGFVKVLEEFLMTAVRFFGNSESMQDILGFGSKGAWTIIEARMGFLASSTNMVRNLQIGTIIMGIMLAIITEIIFFCCKLFEAKKDADAKHMPTDVFQRGIIQLFSEGMVGLSGGLGAAFGMSLVPYAGPFLSPVGYVLGNWIGRLIGALIGRLIVRFLYRYKFLHE